MQQTSLGSSRHFYVLASIFLIVSALYLADEVFIPLALSILLSFLLAPLVSKAEKQGIGRTTSVILVTLFSFAVLLGLGFIVTGQLTDLGTKAPEYQKNITAKLRDLRSSSDGILSTVKNTLNELKREIPETDKQEEGAPGPNGAPAVSGAVEEQPVWTREVTPPPSPINLLRNMISPILGPLGTLGIVIVLSVFMLIHREDLRDRLIRLLGEGRLLVTTEALDESGSKVGRYLLMQLIVNVTYGVPVGLALFLIGIPNAVLWGVMATVLRFIPYLGPWIAASLPIGLSFAISTSWSLPLYTIGIFLFLELVSNNVIEPWLYGQNTGVSPVAILVAAVFWTWLWGTVGLILSTPLTVCLVVAGKYIPSLNFLTILLGDTPALQRYVRIYQRLLAGDQDEASKIFFEKQNKETLPDAYENLLLPALRMLEEDRHGDTIDTERSNKVLTGIKELMDDSQEVYKLSSTRGGESSVLKAGPSANNRRIICLPARDKADELAAQMLAQVANESRGVHIEVLPVETLASEMMEEVDEGHTPIIIISALPPSTVTHTRYLLKRLAKESSSPAKIIVAIWQDKTLGLEEKETLKNRLSTEVNFSLGSSLSEVAEMVRQLSQVNGTATTASS